MTEQDPFTIEENQTPRRRTSEISRRTSSIMGGMEEKTEQEELESDQKFHRFGSQYRALIYRKWIGIKRSLLSYFINILITLIVTCLVIIIRWMSSVISQNVYVPFNFNAYPFPASHIVVVASDYKNNFTNKPFQAIYVDNIKKVFQHDTGREPIMDIFENTDEAGNFLHEARKQRKYVVFGMCVPDEFSPMGGNNLTMIWNDTIEPDPATMQSINNSYIGLSNIYRIELATLARIPNLDSETFTSLNDTFKSELKSEYDMRGLTKQVDFSVIYTFMSNNLQESFFASVAPILITVGLTSIISNVIIHPIIEIQGPVRSYMVSCSLKILPYWIVTFLFDFITWIIEVTLAWILFYVCDIKVFRKQPGMLYYVFIISGISIMIYIYVVSFLFSNPDAAGRNMFIINFLMLLLPMITLMVAGDDPDMVKKLNWIFALIPTMMLEGYMQSVMMESLFNTEKFSFFFTKESRAFPFFIFSFLGIVIWTVILIIIELSREMVRRKMSQKSYGDYEQFFEEQKALHEITPEAKAMEDEVENNSDYAIRIRKVSRLFFNTEGKPIPAVNAVSLGIKKGSLFGFLGANGAGKTTLINMITSMLPVSAGTIEIEGKDISEQKDATLLSVCPQFNTHLCEDLTISEHFHFYSLLAKMSPENEERNTKKLIQLLDIESIKDTPIRELSDGDQRKLAIALSFLGRAKIILLDEPTATLDPVSRHQVHEMILYYRGKKTFMLTTHILNEAEALCDDISIMVKGNVYTIGSPQYLSAKFGTDLKIDMQLNDESDETGEKVDAFFKEFIPEATLEIKRPSARIYNVPASSTNLGDLFEKMEQGLQGDNGFNYYTCSSSSLERVFMEIVRISEGEEN